MESKFYRSDEQRAEKVHELFATIARRYDLLNDIMSAGLHRRWKWRLVERAGPSVKCGDVWIQCAGCPCGVAASAIKRLTVNSHIPEPLRTAHLIAGGISSLPTRKRV